MTDRQPIQRNLQEELTLTNTGFLFDHVSGLTYTVNTVGRYVLQNIIEGKSIADIIKAITEEFDVSETTARKDVEEFCDQMRTFGIL